MMSKDQIIDAICEKNQSAAPGFLTTFDEESVGELPSPFDLRERPARSVQCMGARWKNQSGGDTFALIRGYPHLRLFWPR